MQVLIAYVLLPFIFQVVLTMYEEAYLEEEDNDQDEDMCSDNDGAEIDYPSTPSNPDDDDEEEVDNDNEREQEEQGEEQRNEMLALASWLSSVQELQSQTCGICNNSSCVVLCDTSNGHILSVNEWVSRFATTDFKEEMEMYVDPVSDRLMDYVLMTGPCGNSQHLACVSCLRQIALQLGEQTLRMHHGYIPCAFHNVCDACDNGHGEPYVLADECLRLILTPLEFSHLQQIRYRFLHRGPNCKTPPHDAINHYAWSEGKECATDFPALCTQHSLQNERILEQIRFFLNSEGMEVKCKECGIFLCKSTQCNALNHCGVEVCYVCGYSDVCIPPHHWQDSDDNNNHHHFNNKCPRYDHDKFWNQVAHCNFQCVEGRCYDDVKACCEPTHHQGICNMIEVRRLLHIQALWHSLPQKVQQYVTQHMNMKERETLHQLLSRNLAVT